MNQGAGMSVSVVIPAYNAALYLHHAIDSVIAQTAPVDEIIVVDDGSQDDISATLAPFGSRVRLLRQSNQGASAARNLGVQSATCDWIAFLDADDAWHPQKLKKQFDRLAAAPEAVLCYTGLLNLNPDLSQAVSRAAPTQTLRAELRIGNPQITPSCVLLKRASFLEAGGFDTRQKVCEDWDLWLRLIELGSFCAVDEPLTIYQVSTTGLSSDAEELLAEANRMLDRRLLFGLRGMNRLLWRRRIISYQTYKSSLTARATRDRTMEVRSILLSLLHWPSPFWHPRRYKALAVTFRNLVR